VVEEIKGDNPYVAFARNVIERYVKDGELPDLSEAPELLKRERAGVFVSLKKHGDLRGCIGTIEPVYENVAEEIRRNAASSATRDPRFLPVTADELPDITISVDVLEEPEDIDGIEQLDPKDYGVIVSSGAKVGVLLPDIEGVDTPQEQVRIAILKANIRPGEPVRLKRFRVRRYRQS